MEIILLVIFLEGKNGPQMEVMSVRLHQIIRGPIFVRIFKTSIHEIVNDVVMNANFLILPIFIHIA